MLQAVATAPPSALPDPLGRASRGAPAQLSAACCSRTVASALFRCRQFLANRREAGLLGSEVLNPRRQCSLLCERCLDTRPNAEKLVLFGTEFGPKGNEFVLRLSVDLPIALQRLRLPIPGPICGPRVGQQPRRAFRDAHGQLPSAAVSRPTTSRAASASTRRSSRSGLKRTQLLMSVLSSRLGQHLQPFSFLLRTPLQTGQFALQNRQLALCPITISTDGFLRVSRTACRRSPSRSRSALKFVGTLLFGDRPVSELGVLPLPACVQVPGVRIGYLGFQYAASSLRAASALRHHCLGNCW